MKRVGDSCRPNGNPPLPSLPFILSFFSALSSFHLVSHTISGLHPRGFGPLQPDSSISRGSKSCRFYEPLRDGIYMYTLHVHTWKQANESMSTPRSPLLLWRRFIRTENFPPCKEADERSRAARLPASCMRTLKDAMALERTSWTRINSSEFTGPTIVQNF